MPFPVVDRFEMKKKTAKCLLLKCNLKCGSEIGFCLVLKISMSVSRTPAATLAVRTHLAATGVFVAMVTDSSATPAQVRT